MRILQKEFALLVHSMIGGVTLTWLVLLAVCWLGWQLLRQNGRVLLRLDELEKRLNELEFGGADEPEGLPLGSEAPGFELPDLTGQHHTLAQYRGQPVLLIFFNPDCGLCRELLPKLKEKAESRKQKMELGGGGKSAHPMVLIISTGGAEANRRLFEEHKVGCAVLIQRGTEVAEAYRAHATPSAYFIDTEGKIASELALGAEALLPLCKGRLTSATPIEDGRGDFHVVPGFNGEVGRGGTGPYPDQRANRFRNRSLANSKIRRDGLKAGTPAPDFRLPRLDGRDELSLSELRGKRVLLVFSSPGCGPCNALAPELEKSHREHPELGIVMISKGEPKDNRAKAREHGLTFPILLQQQWEVSRRYAMFATPIAYWIDEAGVIARDVAVGLEAIQALIAEVASGLEESSLPVTGPLQSQTINSLQRKDQRNEKKEYERWVM